MSLYTFLLCKLVFDSGLCATSVVEELQSLFVLFLNETDRLAAVDVDLATQCLNTLDFFLVDLSNKFWIKLFDIQMFIEEDK